MKIFLSISAAIYNDEFFAIACVQAAQTASLINREMSEFVFHGDPGHSRCRTWFENLAGCPLCACAGILLQAQHISANCP